MHSKPLADSQLQEVMKALKHAQAILHSLEADKDLDEQRNRCLFYVGRSIRETEGLRTKSAKL